MWFASQRIHVFHPGHSMTENHNTDSDRITINFDDTADLEIETLDIGVGDGVLAFDITGQIANIPDDKLVSLQDKNLEPTELVFTVTDA